MAQDMSIFHPGAGLRRQVRSELDHLVAETGLERARIQSKGEIEAARTESVGSLVSTTQMAQAEVARVTEALARNNPRIADHLCQTEQIGNVLLLENLVRGAHRIGGLA